MPTSSTLVAVAKGHAASACDVARKLAAADVAAVLGVPEDGVHALVEAGRLTDTGDALDLAERIWRAALPTACDAGGVRLGDAVETAGVGPALWPAVVAALLDGRLNAYRRRGAFGGPVLAALIVSSAEVVAALAAEAEAPFIWTPATDR